MPEPIFILGGAQTDFARHFGREGLGFVDLLREVTDETLETTGVKDHDIDTLHIGNFAGERFCDQGHLGGLLVQARPALEGRPSARHEAACASGSVAIQAARAELLGGLAEISLVVGAELMRHVSGRVAADHLAPAAWAPYETEGNHFIWPQIFSDLADLYDARYGLQRKHLVALAQLAFKNAKSNPYAQTRSWKLPDEKFGTDDAHNPLVAGRLRRHDCSQITDGAAAVLLASRTGAQRWCEAHGGTLEKIPRLLGVGHRTSRVSFQDKISQSEKLPHIFPQVRQCFDDALHQAGLESWQDLDLVETHDCFTSTFYMAIDHLGITAAGESWRAIEDGTIFKNGSCPFNPSGGLIGLGHPVGATGVRMLLDVARQVSGQAGACQVEGAKRGATLNIGGSTTTTVSFVVGIE